MKNFFKKIICFWSLLRCAFTLGWRSLAIYFSSFRNKKSHREFVNKIANRGGIQLLKIVKAKYHYIKPSTFGNDRSYIFMSNHQSLFDPPFIHTLVPGTIRSVFKSELFRVPVLRSALLTSECVPVERKNPAKRAQFMQMAKEKLADGVSLMVFPEGTRSHEEQMLPFKTGCFHLARETATKIIPLGIVGTRNIMPPGKLSISYNENICICVGEPIDTSGYAAIESQDELIKKVRLAIEKLVEQGKAYLSSLNK